MYIRQLLMFTLVREECNAIAQESTHPVAIESHVYVAHRYRKK